MAQNDDFFGDGSGNAGNAGSDEASLDDFFQPAVTQPAASPPPKASPKTKIPLPPKKAAAAPPPPPPEPDYAEPEPEPAPPPPPRSPSKPMSMPPLPPRKAAPPPPMPPPPPMNIPPMGEDSQAQVSDYSEESLPTLPPIRGQTDSLFPSDKPPAKTKEPSYDDEAVAPKSPKKAKTPRTSISISSMFSRVPRLVIFIVIGIIGGMIVGGGAYLGLKIYRSKKNTVPPKSVVATATPPMAPIEKPATEATPPPPPAKPDKKTAKGKIAEQPKAAPVAATVKPAAPPPTTTPKPATTPMTGSAKKAPLPAIAPQPAPAKPVAPTTAQAAKPTTAPKPEVKVYTPKPLSPLPPVKSVSGMWYVHLERLALETSIAKDAELVKKAGLEPFRFVESRSVTLAQFKVEASYGSAAEAHAAAWQADRLGYRPEVVTQGKGAKVVFAVVFASADAQNILSALQKQNIKGVQIASGQTVKKLQALRAGPFKTEAEAKAASQKLKSSFANAMVMKG